MGQTYRGCVRLQSQVQAVRRSHRVFRCSSQAYAEAETMTARHPCPSRRKEYK